MGGGPNNDAKLSNWGCIDYSFLENGSPDISIVNINSINADNIIKQTIQSNNSTDSVIVFGRKKDYKLIIGNLSVCYYNASSNTTINKGWSDILEANDTAITTEELNEILV